MYFINFGKCVPEDLKNGKIVILKTVRMEVQIEGCRKRHIHLGYSIEALSKERQPQKLELLTNTSL